MKGTANWNFTVFGGVNNEMARAWSYYIDFYRLPFCFFVALRVGGVEYCAVVKSSGHPFLDLSHYLAYTYMYVRSLSLQLEETLFCWLEGKGGKRGEGRQNCVCGLV